jgi:hypothetical protein
MKICIQMGHVPRTSGATGAPGEQELNKRIADRLSAVLRDKGFEVKQTDANADTDISVTSVDWDLFLTLHGDANIYGTGGGLVDFPEPNTDGATAESQRIAKCITEEYFKHSEIVNHPERTNANTRYYYMWEHLTAKTPCVLVEMGVVQDAHDKVLLADTDRIANALARGVCKAFNVVFDPVVPPTPPVPDPIIAEQQKTIDNLKITVNALNAKITELDNQIANTPPVTDKACLDTLGKVWSITWGKGWPWSKINAIKAILPK